MKVKLVIQRYGNGLALGMSGRKEDIERQANILYNYKITNAEPIWMCDNFAYILTSDELLFEGMKLKAKVSMIGTRFAKRQIYKGKRMCMIEMLSNEKARRQISELVTETFLNESENQNEDEEAEKVA
jgi:hypothetical protein